MPSGTALYRGATVIATLCAELGDVKDGAIYVQGNQVRWVGPTAELPAEFQEADEVRGDREAAGGSGCVACRP